LLKLGEREQAEIAARFPKVMRRVGGYNIDALVPNGKAINLSSLLVGSEGTLAWSNRIRLKLSPLPAKKAMGVCHFPPSTRRWMRPSTSSSWTRWRWNWSTAP
jgi:FAD/FMN-containing dehydrogenase